MSYACKMTVQMDFVQNILFIGDRLPKVILQFQLIICFFGNWVAVVHSLQ